jgi:hypothetical protein
MRLSSALVLSAGMITAALILRPALMREAPMARSAAVLAADDDAMELGARLAGQAAPLRDVEFTEAQIEHAVDLAGAIDDELARHLVEARERDPAAFRLAFSRIAPRLLAMEELGRTKPDLYELKAAELRNDLRLQREAEELRAAIREGETDRVALLEERLRGRIRVQLAFMMKSRFDYVCSLEEQVEGLHAKLRETGKSFDRLVEKRLAELRRPIER